jgi:hypothetical protein
MLHSPPNAQRFYPPFGHSISTAMSKVRLLARIRRSIRFRKSDDPRRFTTGRARIHLNIERWRVCETWFAPSMAGVDSAGLGEVLQNVLASFSLADREHLVQVRSSSSSPLSLS